MIWNNGNCNIYSRFDREKSALKKLGLDRDYTLKEMNKMFYDLCTDFKLTREGKIIP